MHTDRTTLINRPDIVMRDKAKGKCGLKYDATSGDKNMIKKEADKIIIYKDLTIQIQRL